MYQLNIAIHKNGGMILFEWLTNHSSTNIKPNCEKQSKENHSQKNNIYFQAFAYKYYDIW